MARTHNADFFICPNCGEEVPLHAKVCPGCGSNDTTGWKEGAMYVNAGAPEPMDEDEYAEFVAEHSGKTGVKPAGISWFAWILALLLLLAFGGFFVLRWVR